MKLFVRNLSYDATDKDLRALFEDQGYEVSDARVIMSGEDGRSRGFGFVTVANEGSQAILDFHGGEHMGRVLHVEEAREKVTNGGSRGRRARRGCDVTDNAWGDVYRVRP
jgi:cold-inducible RNA-binding protein